MLTYTMKTIRLQVVSTKVGGVPEVLPPDMIRMAQPNVSGKQTNCAAWSPCCAKLHLDYSYIFSNRLSSG